MYFEVLVPGSASVMEGLLGVIGNDIKIGLWFLCVSVYVCIVSC